MYLKLGKKTDSGDLTGNIIEEKDKFLQEKNHIIETILKKCGDRCE